MGSNKPLLVKLSVVALLVEAVLLSGLIRVSPYAGPHHTEFWLLVLAQFPGVAAAAGVVSPFKAELGPFFFECLYYAVVFLVQIAVLEVIVFAAVKLFGSSSKAR